MKTFLLIASATAALAVGAAETVPTPKAASPLPAAGGSLQKLARQEPPPFNSPAVMQAEFVRRFEASPGFGLSRVLRPVFLAPTPALVCNGVTYTVVPPELVALEDEPVVYAPHEHAARSRGISTNVTPREVRKLFTHRPLTALETNIVAALRQGRDLVVMNNPVARPEAQFELFAPPGLLVYGALRAGKTCAACHQCDQGTLLGAFAYTLNPVSTAADGGTNATPLLSKLR
jgi:hypothetical protein